MWCLIHKSYEQPNFHKTVLYVLWSVYKNCQSDLNTPHNGAECLWKNCLFIAFMNSTSRKLIKKKYLRTFIFFLMLFQQFQCCIKVTKHCISTKKLPSASQRFSKVLACFFFVRVLLNLWNLVCLIHFS